MSGDEGRHDELENIPTLEPWEKQPNESALMFSYFAHYRNEGPRRQMKATARALELGYDTVREYAERYEWKSRAAAWDAYQEQLYQRERETVVREAAHRHRDLALGLQTDVALRLRGGEIVDEQGRVTHVARIDPNGMDYSDMARLARLSVVIERASLGLPTDSLRVTVGQVPEAEYRRLARGMFEIALRHMPEEEHARYAAELEMFFEGGGNTL